LERKITVEAAQQMDARITELQNLLREAHGFIAFGPASEYAKDRMLGRIADALGWKRIPIEAMIERLQNWAKN
jgi:hypothetical protein